MLKLASPAPAGATIFRAIVLPRLAALRRPRTPALAPATLGTRGASVWTTTTAVSTSTGTQGGNGSRADGDADAGASRRPSGNDRARERELPIASHPQTTRAAGERNDHRPIPHPSSSAPARAASTRLSDPSDPLAMWDGLRGPSAVAVEVTKRLISIHHPPPRASSANPNTSVASTSTTSHSNSARSHFGPSPYPRPLPREAPPFPLPIYAFLRERLFRLAVFKILETAEYATDPALIERTASYLERKGAGKLAMRLRRSCGPGSPLLPSISPLIRGPAESPTNGQIAPLALDETPPPKFRVRLWSDPELKDRPRRPPDHWRQISTISSPWASPHMIFPLEGESPGGSLTTHPAGGKARAPKDKLERQRALTRYYNHHLSRLLTGPPSIPDPLGLTTSSKGRPMPRPSPSLRQLYDLTRRIRVLEAHRGFVPDRVTANIMIKCWLRCGLATPPVGHRFSPARGGGGGGEWVPKRPSATPGWREEEIRALWNLMRRLMSLPSTSLLAHGPGDRPTAPTQIRGDEKGHETETGKDTETLHYGRHIRPFCKLMLRAARSVGARELAEEVLEFDREQRRLLRPGSCGDESPNDWPEQQ